jgi:hypothetical protein
VRRSPLFVVAGTAAAVAASIAITGTPGAAAAASCVTVPTTIPAGAMVRSGTTSRVHAGALLFVTLVEPGKYSSPHYPPGFPWQAPSASDRRVLARVPVCRSVRPSTLALTVHAFRAVKPGRSRIVAALAPGWRARATGLARYDATVVVVAGSSAPPAY